MQTSDSYGGKDAYLITMDSIQTSNTNLANKLWHNLSFGFASTVLNIVDNPANFTLSNSNITASDIPEPTTWNIGDINFNGL